MSERIACKNENCKGTILPTTAIKTGGYCMPCVQEKARKEHEEYIRKNKRDVNLYEGINDPIEILEIMNTHRVYDPLINYIKYPKNQEEIYNSLTISDVERLKKKALKLICEDKIDDAIEILLHVVCLRGAEIEECLQALINKRCFYPGVLFKGASNKIRDWLIFELEKDIGELNHILLALSWVGDETVVKLFSEWRIESPFWKNGILISPDKYSFEAGWALTEDGQREDLFYKECLQFVNSKNEDEEDIRIIESHEEQCPWCGCKLTVVFDFNLNSSTFNFLNIVGNRLRIGTCHICTCYGYVFTKVDFDGLSTWYSGNERPKYLPEIANPEVERLSVLKPLVLSKERREPFYAACWVNEVSNSQIGGHPTWINDAEYPICPECSKNMKFIGQIDCSEIEEYGEGIYYAFICKECGIAATNYQQS